MAATHAPPAAPIHRPLMARLGSPLPEIALLDQDAPQDCRLETRRTRSAPAARGPANPPGITPGVTMASPPDLKIALFRSIFDGAGDMASARWESRRSGRTGFSPICGNEWADDICIKPEGRCSNCVHQAFRGMDKRLAEAHLRGDSFIAVHPAPSHTGKDHVTRFAGLSFPSGTSSRADAGAFLRACAERGVPATTEATPEGLRVWILFDGELPMTQARQLASWLVTETMDDRPDIGFPAYDRIFPSDSSHWSGFSDPTPLPLNKQEREHGLGVFVDGAGDPHPDQWAHLSLMPRLPPGTAATLAERAAEAGRVVGLRKPSEDEDRRPWRISGPGSGMPLRGGTVASDVGITLSTGVTIARSGLPPAIVNGLQRLGAFQNPEPDRARAMGRPNREPRVLSSSRLTSDAIWLPRGCADAAFGLLSDHGHAPRVSDERYPGRKIDVRFTGTLDANQAEALDLILPHDLGVIAATPAFGKTVASIAAIAARGVGTLILVHRTHLVEQWHQRLQTYLAPGTGSEPIAIGTIMAKRDTAGGVIDVALINSLFKKGEVDPRVADYGHVVVDECHHAASATFEAVLRELRARYVLALSGTISRKDGRQPTVFFHCGPVRYRMTAGEQTRERPFSHRAIIVPTAYDDTARADDPPDVSEPQGLFRRLSRDVSRNETILADVLACVAEGRSPVVITERRDHAVVLADRIGETIEHTVLLLGAKSIRQRRAMQEKLDAVPEGAPRVIVATGAYLGEGYDDPRLDTLHLAMPISWRGLLEQYVGRLHRLADHKAEVRVYDYADTRVPLLARMAGKRKRGYAALGYEISDSDDLFLLRAIA